MPYIYKRRKLKKDSQSEAQVIVEEYKIFGPPGTGKTTTLSTWITQSAQKYGSETLFVASFTRAAAAELVGRGLPLSKQQLGTLHAHCYRAIGKPEIAELHISEWNKDVGAAYQLTHGNMIANKLDESEADQAFATEGDRIFALYQKLRAKMVPIEAYPPSVAQFHERWQWWKNTNRLIDFTDMIEIAFRDVDQAPGAPRIGFFDETQDFTPLELSVVRKWGEAMDFIVLAGDDDQCVYSFKGATPDAFLEPPADSAHKRVLQESFRVPRSIHAVAQSWVQRLSRREPKEYKPRPDQGTVRVSPITWREPKRLIPEIKQYISDGKTIMVLAACSYMLQPIISELRDAGVPFHNPYRRTRGDWNPLSCGKGVSGSERLLSYLKPDSSVWGGMSAMWTMEDLTKWALILKDVFIRGGKTAMEHAEVFSKELEVPLEDILQWFNEGELSNAITLSLDWFESKILASKRKSLEFPLKVARSLGAKVLRENPKVVVGTIHSVKGGETDCSPPDELVLTTNRGYVPISELDPETDYLVSFNSDHHKIHRGGPRRQYGYCFDKACRPYSGRLLTITTSSSVTRVTPNHYLTIRWAERAIPGYAVYVMRKGDCWRIGTTKLHYANRFQSGMLNRLRRENAEDAWIIGVFDTRKEALFHETLWSQVYGVPDLTFEQKARNDNQLSTNELSLIWKEISDKSHNGALSLLDSKHLDPQYPMWSKSNERRLRQTGTRNRWQVRACNLIPGFMEIPTDPGFGQNPVWRAFEVSASHYEGDVYSLDVERWHHYVSGGAIVHNCVYLFPDLSPHGMNEWKMIGESRDSVIRQFYVGITRARETLVACYPAGSYSVKIPTEAAL